MISYDLNADSGRLADALVSDTLKRKRSKKKTMRPSLFRLSVKPIKTNKTNTRLTALYQDYPGEPVPER